MKTFWLNRTEDVAGVSGTGIVATGVVFDDGQVALWWSNEGAICIFHNIESVERVHGQNGKTQIMWCQ